MAEPTATKDYYFEKPGDLFIRPITVKVRGTFSASGATCTVSSTRRQSHQATITGATGSYAVAGLPTGKDYHVVGCEILPPTGTQLVCIANILAASESASAGTLTLKTRRSDTGAEAAPADGAIIEFTLSVETGVS
jgi:hypothetical protein